MCFRLFSSLALWQIEYFCSLFHSHYSEAGEQRKLETNSSIREELGWTCVPIVVESYGAWGQIATDVFQNRIPFIHPIEMQKIICPIYNVWRFESCTS